MAGNISDRRAQYTVACSCGVAIWLDARSFGKPRLCGSCGAIVTVAWGRDPKSRKTVPVAMVRPPKAKPGAADFIGICACGATRLVSASEHDKKPRCSRCGKVMNVTVARNDRHPSKPSAPLLPLYLRAKDPLQTVVKKNARFFDCVCGLRLTIPPAADKITCPDCDRSHQIEQKAETAKVPAVAPPPRPAPRPRPAAPPPKASPPPPPPVAPSRALKMGEFLCSCGEVQPPRTSRTGRDFTCKACGRQGHVEVDRDPKTQATTMRPVFKSGPTAPPKAEPPPPPPPVASEAGTVTFEELAEPLDLFSGVPLGAEGAAFEVAAGSNGADVPPAIDADAQVVPCECGAEILLCATDTGHTIQCPACVDTMIVEGSKDARTGVTKITLRIVSALDDPDWKLDEFQ